LTHPPFPGGQRNPKELEEEVVKKNLAAAMTAIALLTALAIPLRLAAQDNREHDHQHHHYQLIDMGTFGGPESFVPETSPLVNGHGCPKQPETGRRRVGYIDVHHRYQQL
jgi:hypothetical protein